MSQAILVDASEYQVLCLEIGKAKQRGEDALQRIADLEHELARWKKAIEGLTPSGSEFVNDPEACAAHIRDRYNPLHTFKELRAEIARLTAENRALTDEYHSIREAAREGLSEEQNRAHARTIEKIQFVREQRDALKIECEELKLDAAIKGGK
jgi:predicted  nucleic acid-binding Zn-ribbon protein